MPGFLVPASTIRSHTADGPIEVERSLRSTISGYRVGLLAAKKFLETDQSPGGEMMLGIEAFVDLGAVGANACRAQF